MLLLIALQYTVVSMLTSGSTLSSPFIRILSFSINSNLPHISDSENEPAHLPHKVPWLQTHFVHTGIDNKIFSEYCSTTLSSEILRRCFNINKPTINRIGKAGSPLSEQYSGLNASSDCCQLILSSNMNNRCF